MNLAVLVSGTGTNLASLLAAEQAGELAPGKIVCVVSNRPGVAALDKARAAGKHALVVDHKAFAAREPFEEALLAALAAHGVEAVVLAGFMRVLTARFLDRFPDRILNIHPSLLPSFPGVDAQRQAFEAGVKITGATVHFVNAELDGGAIVMQAAVPVLPDDTADSLRARILVEEHRILPKSVQLLAVGKLRRDGKRVTISP
jgi:phosphoribosylglycinamide formyltransferase-1